MPRDEDSLPDTKGIEQAPWNAKTSKAGPREDPDAGPPVMAVADERFVIGDELGRGGMGRVVAATDTTLERQVAIKQALANDAEGLRRFEREAKITAQLEHASIVPIHDVGNDDDGKPYYIMRRVEGEPLSDLIGRATDAKVRLALVPNVLAAVDAAAFAHAQGVIHCDIKPWNILIGAYGETLLIDWGIARRIDDPAADEGDRGRSAGTPGYMAPEQARGTHLDARADVYALGATLLHVLTGRPVVVGSSTAWLERVAAGSPPPVGTIDRDVPVELIAIVGKAMANVVAGRYCDGGEMAADLRAFLAGQLVAAHPYTAFERLVRFVRRHRVAVATATAAAIAIAMIAVFAIRGVLGERDRANDARAQAEEGQRLARDRAEQLLVDRASALAAHEPTRAVALLRQLPAASRHLAHARDVASVAAANGVASGKAAHIGPIRVLAFAADGKRLLSGGDDGELQVHDVVTSTSRTLVRGKAVPIAVWTDNGSSIAYSPDHQGLYIVDVATAQVRPLEPAAHPGTLWIAGSDDRVRYHDDERRVVVERSTTADGAELVLARDVTFAKGEDDLLLVVSAGELRIIDARGDRVLSRDPALARVAMLAFSEAGSSAIAVMPQGTIEWDLATGEETRRLMVHTSRAFYIGDQVVLSNSDRDNALDRVVKRSTAQVLPGDWSVLWFTRADRGTAVINQSGTLAFIDRRGVYSFPVEDKGVRVIGGRAGVPFIAVGSTAGWLRWWDLRTMIPKPIDVPPSSQVCALDQERLYIRDPANDLVLAYPRSGGAPRSIPVVARECFGDQRSPRFAVRGAPGTFDVIDGATGSVQRILGDLIAFSDRGVFYTHERTVYELPPGGDGIARWTAPDEIVAMAVSSDGIALALANAHVMLGDHGGKVTTIALPRPADFIVLAKGNVLWVASGVELYLVEHALSRLVSRLETPLDWLSVMPDGTAVLFGSDRSIRRVTAGGVVERIRMLPRMRSYGGHRSIAMIENSMQVTTAHLDTGERITRSTRDAGQILLDDRTVLVLRGKQMQWLDVYDDPVPADAARLGAWIDTATNAVLPLDRDELTWR